MGRGWTVVLVGMFIGTAAVGCATDPATEPAAGSASTPSRAAGASEAPGSALPAAEAVTADGGVALPVADADWLQVAGGRVWTSQEDEQGTRLLRLDRTSGKPVATVRTTGSICTAMDVGFGSLWAAVCDDPDSHLLRVDPDTGRVQARIRLPNVMIQEEGSVASGEGFVWLVTKSPERRLVQVDPRTNKVVGTYPVAAGVVAVRAGLGGLWATDVATGALLRLDPRTAEPVTTIPVGAGARFFAVGEGAVWVQNNVDGTVSRVDPATNRVTATITVDSRPVDGGDLAVGGGAVWARVSGTLVARIDPSTNSVVTRYGPAAGSGSVAADEDALWISAHDVDVVYRVPLG